MFYSLHFHIYYARPLKLSALENKPSDNQRKIKICVGERIGPRGLRQRQETRRDQRQAALGFWVCVSCSVKPLHNPRCCTAAGWGTRGRSVPQVICRFHAWKQSARTSNLTVVLERVIDYGQRVWKVVKPGWDTDAVSLNGG